MNSHEYRKVKDRSVRRWLAGFIGLTASLTLFVIGPCDPVGRLYDKWIADLQSVLTLKYGDSIDWDGTVPRRLRYWCDGPRCAL